MKKEVFKKYLPYIVAIVVFVLLAVIYAAPEATEGKVIQAGDKVSAIGMGNEVMQYYKNTGEKPLWTGSMFSGMPNYQINTWIQSKIFISNAGSILKLGLPGVVGMIFLYLFGFFILLRSFKVNKWLSIVGAIAIAFSSYFFIIIEAGHNNKVYGLAYLAAILGGFMFIFDRRYIIGIIVTMVYSAVGLMIHPQMSYYIFMLIGVLLIAELFIHIKEKKIPQFFLSLLLFGCSIAVGLGTNYSTIKANREYISETMRGGHSELTKPSDELNKTKGLDLDYATNWSYGISETMTLMIPNFKGGSSNYSVNENSNVYKTLIQNGVPRKSAADFCQAVPTYWGDQPFTSGPVYVGAILVFLFIFGLLIVKGPYKWALLVATLFSIVLAWGKNFMPFTEFFFNYFPFYNKFRAVSSILIVAEITMPLLGFLAIRDLMDGKVDGKKAKKMLYISAGITAGICLIFTLFGGMFFNFHGANDEQIFANLPEWLSSSIVSERARMLKMDALRSFVLILLCAAWIFVFLSKSLKKSIFIPVLGLLVLIDLWPVDKRFLNNDDFVTEKKYTSFFKKMPYEEEMLKDTDPNYRVLNLTTNTFNESRTSYYFKSIGGYSAAKLRRYQDLIDEHISKEMNPLLNAVVQTNGQLGNCYADTIYPVLNMLNMKYVIVPLQNNQQAALLNPNALGNAWFVDSVFFTSTPDAECEAIGKIDLRTKAVVDKQFEPLVKNISSTHDSTARIQLTSYAPDVLKYDYTAANAGTVVFSEIFYPYGWKAYIDDKPTDHFRADYTLRALSVPAGKHSIRFEFRPDSVVKGEKISYAFIVLMFGTILGLLGFNIYRSKREK